MHFPIALLVGVAAFVSASPTLMSRANIPDPNTVYIDSVKFIGSGCPLGSTSYTLGENNTVIHLGFSSYVVAQGDGIPITENRKNCAVDLVMHYPQGWTYSISTTDFRGFVSLDRTCTASLGADMYFSGQQEQAHVLYNLKGPLDGKNHRQTVEVGTESLVWARCGAIGPIFNINSQAMVQKCKKPDEGTLTVDSQDTKFEVILQLQWRRCNV
ncbi:hypothetical protein EJ08DRAFT_261953 [Tothia fuscella]|uniref:Secreted protein n=1 Tax=Tothia fuscella TaxID=1048955 RepID=A0A9P4NQL9_9PEZI|nr:hypothetical protein EJ08DRAFT_261953 [Tothia fuscella]